MVIKSWTEAHRYKGGIIRYLYDTIKSLDSADGYDDTALKGRVSTLESKVAALEAAAEESGEQS